MFTATQMLADVRENLDEPIPAHWTDLSLLRKLNQAQRELWMYLAQQPGDWFLTHESVTPVDGVITLPTTCAKPVYLENASSGYPIWEAGSVQERRLTRVTSTTVSEQLTAYLEGATLVVNSDSFSEACTLWYIKNCVDLSTGDTGDNSGTDSVELDGTMEPSSEDNYYNGSIIEIDGTRYTITDYDGATKIATVSGSISAGTSYGTLSILPEEAIPSVILKATTRALAKPSGALDTKYYQFFRQELRDAFDLFKEWLSSRGYNNRIRTTNWE